MDHLRAAECRRPPVNDVELMTTCLKLGKHSGSHPVFNGESGARLRAESRRLNVLLRGHTKHQQIMGYLENRLGLAVATGGSERKSQLTVRM